MKSTLLVTQNTYDLPNVRSVNTFKNVEWEGVDCLIFHSSADSHIELVKELSTLRGKVSKVIYVNKNINALYYCIFTGLDADIYDSEEYLMDSETIDYLISDYKNTGMTITSPSSELETVAKSIALISEGSIENIQELLSNPFWTRTLTTAVAKVDRSLSLQNEINMDVLEVLSESGKYITNLEVSSERTSIEIEKLQRVLHDAESRTRSNTPFFFNTYEVPVTVPKVLYVKGYGDCRYLNSFLLNYQHYLKMEKQYSSKILFMLPKLPLYMQKYKDGAVRLGSDSVNIVNMDSHVFITFEPKKVVMDMFFNQPNTQIFIVVDLMFGDLMVKGHMVEKVNSVSGFSDIPRFNLQPERTIVPISATSANILIPHINRYAQSNESTKRSMYFEKCKPYYQHLDKIILKDGR